MKVAVEFFSDLNEVLTNLLLSLKTQGAAKSAEA